MSLSCVYHCSINKTKCQFLNMKTILFGLLLAVSAAFVSAQPVTGFFYSTSVNSVYGERTRLVDKWGASFDGSFSYGGGSGFYADTAHFNVVVFGEAEGSPVQEGLYFDFRSNPLTVGQDFIVEQFATADMSSQLKTDTGLVLYRYDPSLGDLFVFPELVSGSFRLMGLTRADYVITSLAVDFWQFEGDSPSGDAWAFGSLRYNSDIPLTVSIPEPSTYGALAGILILCFALCARRKARQTNSV
jgi:hypothetical protein